MSDNQKDKEFKKDNLPSTDRNTELFHGSHELYVLFKRLQNISAALFLITSSFNEDEELRISLRRACLQSLSAATQLVQNQSINIATLRKIAGPILEIISLVSVGYWSGLISEMNNIVLQRELAKLEHDIQESIIYFQTKFLVPQILFKDTEKNIDTEFNTDSFKGKAQQDKEEVKFSNKTDVLYKGHDKRQIIKDNIKDNGNSKNERRSAILRLLNERQNLGVKDFTNVIPGVSEKTIQRELLTLVAEGLIKKEGERRWSTYSRIL